MARCFVGVAYERQCLAYCRDVDEGVGLFVQENCCFDLIHARSLLEYLASPVLGKAFVKPKQRRLDHKCRIVRLLQPAGAARLLYRVRARDARIRVMRRTTLTSTCKNKAIEPRIVVIIIRNFGGMFSRHVQQIFAM